MGEKDTRKMWRDAHRAFLAFQKMSSEQKKEVVALIKEEASRPATPSMILVPADKFPLLAKLQQNDPERYQKAIKGLLKDNPEGKEQDVWGQLESDFQHVVLS